MIRILHVNNESLAPLRTRYGTLEELAGSLRGRLPATGHALWRYRVALHDAALTALRG
jgi:hypothetical protein